MSKRDHLVWNATVCCNGRNRLKSMCECKTGSIVDHGPIKHFAPALGRCVLIPVAAVEREREMPRGLLKRKDAVNQ